MSAVAGYNVYRRTAARAYDLSSPLNGSTPLAAVSHADPTAVDATTYRYVVCSVISGAGGAHVESESSDESAAVTADGVAPPAPTAVSVTSGGNVCGTTSCGVASVRGAAADGPALVDAAAKALIEAKHSGKNRSVRAR